MIDKRLIWLDSRITNKRKSGEMIKMTELARCQMSCRGSIGRSRRFHERSLTQRDGQERLFSTFTMPTYLGGNKSPRGLAFDGLMRQVVAHDEG